jgi:hypothetical protein
MDPTLLLPPAIDIPDRYWMHNCLWNEIANHWFNHGLSHDSFIAKPGINKKDAIGQLFCAIRSNGIKHDTKIAGVAYLLSEWFEKVEMV